MLIKLKIVATKHTSYLTAMTDIEIDTEKIEKEIQETILDSLNSDYIVQKGNSNGSIYFLLTDFTKSREFITELVTKAALKIKARLLPKMDIAFYCAIQLFDTIVEMQDVQIYLDKMLNVKIKNKIIVAPRVRIYFDEMLPQMYQFDVVGEYNLSDDIKLTQNVMIHSLRRRNI